MNNTRCENPLLTDQKWCGLNKVGSAGTCNFPKDSCKFPTEEIMSGQNFNLFFRKNFPKAEVFQPPFRIFGQIFSDQNFLWTAHNSKESNCPSWLSQQTCMETHTHEQMTWNRNTVGKWWNKSIISHNAAPGNRRCITIYSNVDISPFYVLTLLAGKLLVSKSLPVTVHFLHELNNAHKLTLSKNWQIVHDRYVTIWNQIKMWCIKGQMHCRPWWFCWAVLDISPPLVHEQLPCHEIRQSLYLEQDKK